MNTVQLGPVPIGDAHPVALVAEIGTFFNQDLGLARNFLQRAAAAGVALFKTEILHDAEVCLRGSGLEHRFNHATGAQVEDYRQLIERKVVPLSGYAEIFALSRELGLPFLASVYDFTGVDFLVAEGAVAIKIARHNITHYPLIAHAARTGLPVILDAGLVYLDELAKAVRTAQDAGAPVIINHHPGLQPTPAAQHHLRAIQRWKQTFDVPVGLSCHYRGDEVLYAAVGVGVNLIEKGVVDDNERIEQDVVSAMNLSELPAFCEKLRNSWLALGSTFQPIPEPRNLSTRKGLVARAAISAGELLSLQNVGFAWPPLGVKVDDWEKVEGGRAVRAMASGEVIEWKDIHFDQ